MASQCPLFTPRHIHHSTVWALQGFSIPTFCFACATERLEDKSEISLHTRRVLSELQALLAAKSSSLIHILSSDKRVLDHFSNVVFGLLVAQDATIAQLAMEVLEAIASQLSTTEIPRKLLQKTIQTVMAMQKFSDGLPYLTLLGRLLHSLPPLCREMTHSFGGFLEYLLSGLAYPEESVKSAVVYILAQLIMKTQQNSLSMGLVCTVCQFISSNLASAKSHNLTLNLLGLVKGLLKSSVYAQCLLQTDRHTSEAKGSTLASAFKRVLLSSDETLQLSGVQCVAEVLVHHPQYGQTLLHADIAEFMFEALNSKKELLMTSLFSCLNSLATLNDFYSKGHVIYGIDQVISGMRVALEMKNHTAARLGFTFLSVVLQRQPATMPLFSAATAVSLHKLLSVVQMSLQTPAPLVVQSAISAFSYLLCVRHLPPEFSLSTLLPLLSLLLHLVELHLMPPASTEGRRHSVDGPRETTSPDIALNPLQLLTSVLMTMENMHKVCLDAKKPEYKDRFIISGDITTFLSISFEENLLPAILLNAEALDRCEPLAEFFTIARIHLEGLIESSPTSTLAVNLVRLGFIHFSFDMKSKFFSAPGGILLCNSINGCVESLCAQLESDNPQRVTFVRETLHATLPDINCELEKSLEFLLQRSSHDVVQSGSRCTPAQIQRAVLALFYLSHHKSESVVTPADVVLHALGRFLILNPDVHLMPAPSLAHLTALYAASVVDISSKPAFLDSTNEGTQILVRALLHVPSPVSIFSSLLCLLSWTFAQPPLQDIARTWFWEWLRRKCDGENVAGEAGERQPECWSEVVQFVQTTPNALDILLDTSCGEVSATTLSLVEQLLSEQCIDASGSLKTFHYLQKILLAHRIQPLSESVTASLMKLLAKCIRLSSATPDIKLVYHVVNFITRYNSDGIVTGLHLLCEILCDSKEVNLQVLALLQNNVSFLERLVSLVPSSSQPKDHSVVSASALRLVASLIHHHHQTKLSSLRQSGAVISTPSALATLLAHSTSVLVSGLYFWHIVISTGANTGCFVLCDPDTKATLEQDMQALKKLLFLVQNCLIKDDQAVREAAALCLTQLFQYLETTSRSKIIEAALTWNRVIIDHISTTSVHSHIPTYYLPCLTAIIGQTSPAHSFQLKPIAQLLYESITNEHNSTDTLLTKYTSCFKEIQKIDRNLLDVNQWAHLNKALLQTSH